MKVDMKQPANSAKRLLGCGTAPSRSWRRWTSTTILKLLRAVLRRALLAREIRCSKWTHQSDRPVTRRTCLSYPHKRPNLYDMDNRGMVLHTILIIGSNDVFRWNVGFSSCQHPENHYKPSPPYLHFSLGQAARVLRRRSF